MFQIKKRSQKTFEWIYYPTITDHIFFNIGSEAQPMTTIKTTPEASHIFPSLAATSQNSGTPSQKDFAIALGVTISRISQLVKIGMPLNSIAAAKEWRMNTKHNKSLLKSETKSEKLRVEKRPRELETGNDCEKHQKGNQRSCQSEHNYTANMHTSIRPYIHAYVHAYFYAFWQLHYCNCLCIRQPFPFLANH